MCYIMFVKPSAREPGSDERVALGGVTDALFAFRQGWIQEQVSVSQYSQNWSLWTLSHLHIHTTAVQLKQ